MNDLKCKIHDIELDCLAGCSAHPDNWYCRKCAAIPKCTCGELPTMWKNDMWYFVGCQFCHFGAASSVQLQAITDWTALIKARRIADHKAEKKSK